MVRVEVSDFVEFSKVEGADLYNGFTTIHVVHLLLLERIASWHHTHVFEVVCVVLLEIAKEVFSEALGNDEVEHRDHIGGVVFQLSVQRLVVLENVVAVHVQDVLLSFHHFLQFFNVEGRFCEVFVFVAHLHKGVDEVLYLVLNVVEVDICAPNDLGVAALFVHVGDVAHDAGGHMFLVGGDLEKP